MAKPAIMVVDDDAEVLRALERDLRREYGSRFRVLRADSGAAALEALKQLEQRNEPLALILSDQRMPQMSGVEFLAQARELFPGTRSALLTAYADSEAAVQAINQAHTNYYLLKPWDPPEEKLYPAINDLLDDWLAGYRPPYEGIQVIGQRWSPATHEVKDFLARNQIPYRALDIESDQQAARLLATLGLDKPQLPVVVFADGSHLEQPELSKLAEKVGLQTQASLPFYDFVIVGAGPAGLAAAVYGASEGLHTVLIEREAPGGQAGTSSLIENYLGFPSGVSGADLARRSLTQARKFGVEVLAPQEVKAIKIKDQYRVLTFADGGEISCHAMLIASGVAWRKLDVPGIERLTGAGVYYGAATTEAISCQDNDVFIVGGANSAGQAAIFFANYARSVTLIVRGDSLEKGMSQYLVDHIGKTEKIHVRLNSNVVEVQGEDYLNCIILEGEGGKREKLTATALFIFIGAEPRTEWLRDSIALDDKGFILSGSDLAVQGSRPLDWKLDRDPFLLETCIPGVFVAGDVRHGSIKRVASAVGEGSIAVQFIHQYLSKL